MQDDAERNVPADSQTECENNPLAHHGVDRLLRKAGGHLAGTHPAGPEEDYAAGVFADSISVAVMRLER